MPEAGQNPTENEIVYSRPAAGLRVHGYRSSILFITKQRDSICERGSSCLPCPVATGLFDVPCAFCLLGCAFVWAAPAAMLAGAPEAIASTTAPREKLIPIVIGFNSASGTDPARIPDSESARRRPGTVACFAKGQRRRPKWRGLSDSPHDWAVELPFVRDEELSAHGYVSWAVAIPRQASAGTAATDALQRPRCRHRHRLRWRPSEASSSL